MRAGWLIVDVMYLLVCVGVVIYKNSGKRAGQPQPRWPKSCGCLSASRRWGDWSTDLIG